jgi:hypothetical protein
MRYRQDDEMKPGITTLFGGVSASADAREGSRGTHQEPDPRWADR